MTTTPQKPQEKSMTAKEWLKTKPNYVQDYLWCTDGTAVLLEEYTTHLRARVEELEGEKAKLCEAIAKLPDTYRYEIAMLKEKADKWDALPDCNCNKPDPDSLGYGVPFCRNCNRKV